MFYIKLGNIPQKRHVQFKQPNGSLYYEELISTEGFDSVLSNVYHINMPPKIDSFEKEILEIAPVEWEDALLLPYHFRTSKIKRQGDFVTNRNYLVYNDTVWMSVSMPEKEIDYFYKNASCDELIYVDSGEGELQTNLGYIKFKKGDYIVIPRNILYRLKHDSPAKLLIFEAFGMIKTPKRYRSEFGQLLEHSPFCERDIRTPELVTIEEKGDFVTKIKKYGKIFTLHYDYNPFDIAGYDGFYFPYIFNIDDFMPITGKIHQPPPVHQTFDGPGFVICSFVSRMLDYHPEAIPVPYNHSNVDSDEILYYADGQFSSRKGIENGSISLHPGGLPHGPHPGRVEASLGKKETIETAVMMDTFKPLKISKFAKEINDEEYPMSWK